MAEFCLRCVDLETTGFLEEQPDAIKADPCLGIVELGWTDVLVNVGDDNLIRGVEVDGAFGAILFNPPGGIPPEASAIHHLTAKHVAHAAPATGGALAAIANSPPWRGPDKPMALVAHFADFERSWLDKYLPAETRWVCSLKAAARLYPDFPSHSNQALKYRLGIELDDALCQPPHRAGPDSLVTAHIVARMLTQTSVKQMVAWTKEPRLMTRCPIGDPWRGKPWAEVEEGFIRWAINKPIDDADCIFWMKAELERRAQAARQPVAAEEGEDY